MSGLGAIVRGTSLGAPGARRRDAVRLAVQVGAVMFIEAVLAAGVVHHSLGKLVLAVLGLGVAAIIWRWPLVGLVGVFILIDSAISPDRFGAHIGPIDFRDHELLTLVLFLRAALQPRRRTWGGTPGALLALALAILVATAGLGVLDGRMSLHDAWNWGRHLIPLVLVYVVLRLVPDRAALERLLLLACVVAAGTGLVAILGAAGLDLSGLRDPYGTAAVNSFVSNDVTEGIVGLARVRLPGVDLAYGLFWYAAYRFGRSRGEARLGWSLVLAAMLVNIALSFNRNMWLGLVIGAGVLAMVGGVRVHRRVVAGLALVATVGAVFALVHVPERELGVLGPIVARGQTLLQPAQLTNSASVQDRVHESQAAWQSIQRHPLTGVGVGAPFGATIFTFDGYSLQGSPQLFLHNQYLYLLVIGGVPLLIAFVAFLLSVLDVARFRLRDPVVVALCVPLATIVVSAMVTMWYSDQSATSVVSLTVAGILIVAGHRPRAEARSAALAPARAG